MGDVGGGGDRGGFGPVRGSIVIGVLVRICGGEDALRRYGRQMDFVADSVGGDTM